MNERPSFLDMPAPAGYKPGLGRGAIGFTTRSDVGTANIDTVQSALREKERQKQRNQNEAEYDSDDSERFADAPDDDAELGLFAKKAHDKDDDDAELIYSQVEERISQRRSKAKLQNSVVESKPKPQNDNSQFADLKRGLAQVSAEEWADLPEVGDITKKNKRQRLEQKAESRFYAVPDSVVAAAASSTELATTINDQEGPESERDFKSIASAKDKLLNMALGASESSNSVDPSGYLTSLSSSTSGGINAGEIGDVNRARLLLESLVRANPLDAGGWIGLARVEEMARDSKKALQAINNACEQCFNNEDVWLESIRLNERFSSGNNKDKARLAAKRATSALPDSTKLWMSRIALETETLPKKRIVQQALIANPTSAVLWKAAVNLETDKADAKLLLETAVDQIPMDEELWLTLAHLETVPMARKVLNRARKTLKSSRVVWVAAAKLEENDHRNTDNDAASGSDPSHTVYTLLDKGITELIRHGSSPELQSWLDLCYDCEKDGYPITCAAIIRASGSHELSQKKLERGLDEKAQGNVGQNFAVLQTLSIWTDLAEAAERSGHIVTARNIFSLVCEQALATSSSQQTIDDAWMRAVRLEKNNGSRTTLYATLRKAIDQCPTQGTFWRMLIDEKVHIGDYDGALTACQQALESVSGDSSLWLTTADIYVTVGDFDQASKLLQRARASATMDHPERVWIRSVVFERELAISQLNTKNEGSEEQDNLKNAVAIYHGALSLVDEALSQKQFANCTELYIQKGQILQHSLHDIAGARATYQDGTRKCPQSTELWSLLAELEIERGGSGGAMRSRAVLDRASLVNPHSQELWASRIILEIDSGNEDQARKLAAQALQQCPSSGLIWSLQIRLTPYLRRKTQIMESIRRLETSESITPSLSAPLESSSSLSYVLTAAAKFFWMDGKLARVQSWMDRAIKSDPNNGDSWLWLYKYTLDKGNQTDLQKIETQFMEAAPKAGYIWSQRLRHAQVVGQAPLRILQDTASQLTLDG